MRPARPLVVGLVCCVALAAAFRFTAGAPAAPVTFAASVFGATWSATDEAVASGAVGRAWLWGPAPTSPGIAEQYQEAPGGTRLVQYFDKARMELTDPVSGAVTTGLLTRELVTGRIQVGDGPNAIDARPHGGTLPLAGDVTNTAPTYAQLRDRIDRPRPDETGQFVADMLELPAGGTGETPLVTRANGMPRATDDPNAKLAHFVPETGQTIPQAFRAFLTAGGPTLVNGALVERTPLYDWRSVAGYPIMPAFWATVRVGGAPTLVMVQLFERRVLTYTPSNPAGFQVEMGNIGQHYFQFRYLGPDATLLPATAPPIPPSSAKPPKSTTAPRPTVTPVITGTGPVRLVGLVAHTADGTPDPTSETVTIRNDSLATVDISRWSLVDRSGKNIFVFPAFALLPGGAITVHSGRGTNSGNDLYWGKTVSIWNNHGDTATLRDASGAVVSTFTFG